MIYQQTGNTMPPNKSIMLFKTGIAYHQFIYASCSYIDKMGNFATFQAKQPKIIPYFSKLTTNILVPKY